MAILNIDLKVRGDGSVQIDKVKKSAKATEKATNNLKKSNKELSNSYKDLKTDLGSFVGTAATIYGVAKAFEALYTVTRKVVFDGFEFNKQMEESKAGLQALSLAIQDQAIPLTERLASAQKESIVVMKELQKVNTATPHTLNQTNQIYKTLYVSMKNVGASSREIIDLTQKLSVASGAAGIEFNSLLAGVDGIASGTVLANSNLGRFLSSLGLTNEVIKKSTDVVGLLNEKLADFRQLDTITTATSNLSNSWGELTGKLTQDIFSGSKDGLNEISTLLKSMSDEDIKQIRESFNGMAIGIMSAITGMAKGVVFLADGFESLGARIAEAAFRLEHGLFLNDAESAALDRMIARTQANIAGREAFITTLEKSEQALIKSINSSQTSIKVTIDQAEAEAILTEKIDKTTIAYYAQIEAEAEAIYKAELEEVAKINEAQATDTATKAIIRNIEYVDSMSRYYDEALQSVEAYSNGINSLSRTLSAAEQNRGTTGVYRTTTGDYSTSPNPFFYNRPGYGGMTSGYGYADGGYTGDGNTSSIAGVVHKQEYVVDAQTTQDLGLNGKGGIFESMNGKLDQLAHLHEINKTIKKLLKASETNNTLLLKVIA